MNTLNPELAATHARLLAAWRANKPGVAQRRDDLRRLRAEFRARQSTMDAAIQADFGHRSTHENLIAETLVVIAEIDHALAHLSRWTRPRRAAVGWRLWPARAKVRPMAVGVVGIIAPWNYPVNLALVPLVSAIAAGNHVHLKPSEHTPRTSEWLRDLLAAVFPDDRVATALGGAEIGAAFASLPFDHLLFTGSTAVGRKVMTAAAPNLTPVTLELGGKAPAIVAADFDVDLAASRIATGKWFNAGQTCIGVDYALIDRTRRDTFVAAVVAQLHARYGDLPASADYTRIISDAQFARLRGYVDEARAAGATVIAPFGEGDASTRLLPPTLVLDPPSSLRVMQEEIFGPILPVVSYDTLDDAIARVASLERPLAMYPFSGSRETVQRLVEGTLAGGVTVNDTLLHFGAQDLPFGGIGPSGMGAIHGRAGFDTFSKLLPVFEQRRFAVTDLLRPPYARLDGVIRWLAR
ncbi:coniferyl aldehyde dehydrogenase [Lysobacter claricitrinus]|uniref:coniferyl aldehyde dehydrogenase n=1 Tax=Lysobacter claricitrinus TaxID=3367728 RepID=UPI0037DB3C57